MIRTNYDNRMPLPSNPDAWEDDFRSSSDAELIPSSVVANDFQSPDDYALSVLWNKIYDKLDQTDKTQNVFKKTKNYEKPEISKQDVKNAGDVRFWFEFSENRVQLLSITTLDLFNCKLKAIPEELKYFYCLKGIELGMNEISEIPEFMGSLIDLEAASFGNNQIKKIPNSFKNLVKLQHLNLMHNRIEILPCSIINLTQLKSICIINKSEKDNRSQEFSAFSMEPFNNADALENCLLLESICLNEFQIPKIPNFFSQMNGLVRLEMKMNKISEIPDWIGEQNQLISLILSANEISEMPISLGQLTNLEVLDLSGNKISIVHNIFQNMTKLKRLNLGGNLISELPESISLLDNLSFLSINNNQFSKVPDCVKKLPKLEILHMHDNRIDGGYDEDLDNLANQLSILNIKNNPISNQNYSRQMREEK